MIRKLTSKINFHCLRMGFSKIFLILLIVTTYILAFTNCAPTSSTTLSGDAKKSSKVKQDDIDSAHNPCETEELASFLECESSDKECESKNQQSRQKRETICEKYPQCQYCDNVTSLEPEVDLADYEEIDDDENLMLPEIVATVHPPSEFELSGQSIVIEGSVENIANEIEEVITAADANKPVKLIERNIVVENDNEKHYYRGFVDPSTTNVTTIIRLTNLINNTNVVNMPTTLNNTNINNIHVFNNKSSGEGGKFGLGYTEDGPCCYAIKPGSSCKTTTVGLKCRHKKIKMCGRQCTNKMINNKKSACKQIPQYPYVFCAPQSTYLPPQYQLYPPYAQYPQIPKIDDGFDIDNDDDDDDDFPLFPDEEELENIESDWIVHQEKCKVVSEDGLQITNCTQKNFEFEHPYARNSVDKHNSKRHARNAEGFPKDMDVFQQQQSYNLPYAYPMIMQPVYFQPVPMLMPQYFLPQQQQLPSNYYYQQMPSPQTENRNRNFEEPIIEIREGNPYKYSKKHSKKHPVKFEFDDEL